MTARPASDLAADVEQGFSDYLNYRSREALAELVARLEAAQAEPRMFTLAEMQEVREAGRAAEAGWNQALKDAADLLAHLHRAEAQVAEERRTRKALGEALFECSEKRDAAEAQVAALTQERDAARTARDLWKAAARWNRRRRKDAGAALADTRRALEQIRDGYDGDEFQDSADALDDMRDIASRALAAAGGGTAYGPDAGIRFPDDGGQEQQP